MKNIFYVSDLDGTLLRDDTILSDYSRQRLQGLLDKGLQFTVASARSVVSMKPILADMALTLPVIEFNGAFISDLTTGQHQIVNDIETAVVEEIYLLSETFQQKVFISTFDGARDRAYYCDIVNDGMKWYLEDRIRAKDERMCFLEDLKSSFKDQVVCITIIGKGERLDELAVLLEERYKNQVELHYLENQYSPGWYWLTVHDRRATKDQAIHRLMKEYDLEDNELVVFGDNLNDLKMFQLADRAYAVENAVDELKKQATRIIGSNHDDAVVRFIEKEWSGR